MKVNRQGFDTLHVAFQGALPKRLLEALAIGKDAAKRAERAIDFELGGVAGVLYPNGTKAESGYAYIFDTGPMGEVWKFKRSTDPEQWNLFCEVGAMACATLGFEGVVARLLDQLEAFRAIVITESINRIDYAVDVETGGDFALNPNLVICHARSTVSRHFKDDDDETDGFRQIIGNRKVSSVTVGRNPGRVVQIYDKRHEQKCRQKSEWFELWGTTKEDCPEMWRVELRAHKKHLKDWNVSTFDDVRQKLGDVFLGAVEDVRYVQTTDVSNISRAPLHELWLHVRNAMFSRVGGLAESICGHKRGRVVAAKRSDVEKQLSAQIKGCAATLSVVLGADAQGVRALPANVADLVHSHLFSERWAETRKRAQDRYHWIEERKVAA